MTAPSVRLGPAPDPAPDTVPARRFPVGPALWGASVLALLCYLAAMSGVSGTDLDRMNGLGLVSALPPLALLAACALGALYFLALNARAQRPRLLLFLLLATVLALHGAAAMVEPVPRFATAWQHLGFIDYIERTGHTLPVWDARFSWPGFFGLAALLLRVGGVDDPMPLLQWSQVGSQLLCLAALAVLLRALALPRRAFWCALWFFVAGSWVGQDYFSPQGFTYALYLCFVAVLVSVFRRPGPRRDESPDGGEGPDGGGSVAERGLLLGLLTVLFLASVAAHQLTPFVMIACVGLLWLVRRTALSFWFPVLLGAVALGWISLEAEAYWSGHLNVIFGGMGQVGGNVTSGVAGRVKGDPAHQAVLALRVLLSGGWFGLAVLGWWRGRRAGRRDRELLVLAFMPFFTLGMQSYGGEIALRVFLFALPGVAALAALFFYPAEQRLSSEQDSGRQDRPPRWTTALVTLWAVCAVAAFGVARYGNEQFERVTAGEVAALNWAYDHASPSERVLYLGPVGAPTTTPALPWNQRAMERVAYVGTAAPVDPREVGTLETALRTAGPQSVLIVTSSEGADLTANDGYAPGWYGQARAALDADPRLVAVVSAPDAALYQLADAPRGTAPTDIGAGPIGPILRWNDWTIAEAGLLAVLVPLLLWHEVARLTTGPWTGARRWGFGVLAGVLLAGFLLAVAERFLTLR